MALPSNGGEPAFDTDPFAPSALNSRGGEAFEGDKLWSDNAPKPVALSPDFEFWSDLVIDELVATGRAGSFFDPLS